MMRMEVGGNMALDIDGCADGRLWLLFVQMTESKVHMPTLLTPVSVPLSLHSVILRMK
jgi:hypothetical protein